MRKRRRASAITCIGVVAVSTFTIPVLFNSATCTATAVGADADPDASADDSDKNKRKSSNSLCVDNPNYVSPFGKLGCDAYRDLNCEGFRDVAISGGGTSDNGNDSGGRDNFNINAEGSDIDHVSSHGATFGDASTSSHSRPAHRKTAAVVTGTLADEILLNCPKSCGVDSCETDSHIYWDELINSYSYEVEDVEVSSLTGIASDTGNTKGATLHQKITNGREQSVGASSYSTQHHLTRGCFEGWDPTCRDDPAYRCLNGLSCEAYEDYDCTKFTSVGYSEAEVADLIYHCPCSCEIECGTWEKSDMVLNKFTNAFKANSSPTAAQASPPTQLVAIGNDNRDEYQASSRLVAEPRTGTTTTQPITITLESKLFELSMYPMSRSLDFQAISDLSVALDETIIANIDDIMGSNDRRSVEVNTFLLFQFLQDRSKRKRRILAEGVVTGDGGTSVATAIDQAMYNLLHDQLDDTMPNSGHDEGVGSKRALTSTKSLHLGIMKLIYVTVPSVGGVHDNAMVPDSDTIDLAVLTVFTNMHQSRNLLSRLQSVNPRHFSSLETIEFISFLKEPTESPSASPSTSPSFVPSMSPTESPTLGPTFTQSDPPSTLPTRAPTSHPSQRPTAPPTLHPTLNPSELHSDEPSTAPSFPPTERPTNAPTIEPEAIAVNGNVYEIKMHPVTGFLDFRAITQLNAIVNGVVYSNLVLPTTQYGKARARIASALLSQELDVKGSADGEAYGSLIVRVQTTAFVTIPQAAADASGPYKHHLLPSIETIDEAIYRSYSDGNEERVAAILRTSPAKQFEFVADVSFERFIFPPTPLPSVNPSTSPTDRPSHVPSVSPTGSPSDRPTVLPSQTPSSQPSASPTLHPTMHPTDFPSSRPSMSPSDDPSSSPSLRPTVEHSDVPSEVPSVSPSDAPSANPSASPSDKPSPSPSDNPSVAPSSSPSAHPSKSPTDQPTTHPSYPPSSSPSSSPTHSPSESPSASPTFYDALVAVEGNVFELSMTPVNTYLYVNAFNQLNDVFDDMIINNLILPDEAVVTGMEFSTVMSSQGLKRRGLKEVDEKDVDDDEKIVDLLRVDIGGNNYGIGNIDREGDYGGLHRRTRFGSSSTLYVRLQKTLLISVPSIGQGGQYDPRHIPDTATVDEAISTVFTNPMQSEYFVQRLRHSTINAFTLLDAVEFSGFMYPPTEAPSAAPSSEPTAAPTSSRMPSTNPSVSPSSPPSRFPTKMPTRFPTQHPSPLPSAQPSDAPSPAPTSYPSLSPTNPPTPLHSSAPSLLPSASPTPEPVTVTVHGHIFELRLSPVSLYLDYEAFTAINFAMDDLVLYNIHLPHLESRHMEASITLFSQFKTTSDLLVSLQLTAFVTVPAAGESSVYDDTYVPTASQLDMAVQSMLTDVEQRDALIHRLRSSESVHFANLNQVELKRFILPPTLAPTLEPTVSPSRSPTSFPTHTPTVPKKTFEVKSGIFDFSLAPMQSYLDVGGVTPINAALDEMIAANLVLPGHSGNAKVEAVSIFLSQGLHWTSKSLTIRMQAAAYVEIPDDREDLLPEVDAINSAVVSVFLNDKQKDKFIAELQNSGVISFVDLRHAVFLGFYN